MQKPDPSSIPLSPGVYLYRDGKGQVIYVGKARILRRRVLSYFRPEGLPAKTKAMLAHAQSIEFLTTTTERKPCCWKPASSRNTGRITISCCATTSSTCSSA